MKKVTINIVAFDEIEAARIAREMKATSLGESGVYTLELGHISNLSNGDKFRVIKNIDSIGELLLFHKSLIKELYFLAKLKEPQLSKIFDPTTKKFKIFVKDRNSTYTYIYDMDDEDEWSLDYQVLLDLLPNIKK